MAPMRMPLLFFVLASFCAAENVTGKCKETDWGNYCPRICSEGLGRKMNRPHYFECMNTCFVHSITTRKNNGKKQGMYMQKCMQEYCSAGECGQGKKWGKKSLLSVGVHRHQTEGVPKHPLSKHEQKHPKCKKGDFYCSEMCKNLFHPVMSDIGQHPGTKGCKMMPYKCPTQDECIKECNWEAMKPIYEDFCTCEKEIGRKNYPYGLVQD